MTNYTILHESAVKLAEQYEINLPPVITSPFGTGYLGDRGFLDGTRIYLDRDEIRMSLGMLKFKLNQEIESINKSLKFDNRLVSSCSSVKFGDHYYGFTFCFDVGTKYNIDNEMELYNWSICQDIAPAVSRNYYDVLVVTPKSMITALAQFDSNLREYAIKLNFQSMKEKSFVYSKSQRCGCLKVEFDDRNFLWEMIFLKMYFASLKKAVGGSQVGWLSEMRINWSDIPGFDALWSEDQREIFNLLAMKSKGA